MPESRRRGRKTTYLISPSPSPRELSPQRIPSAFDCYNTNTTMSTSRPTSVAFLNASSSPYISPPSLQEILSGSAPPPWTYGAFTAFLSQNHCLETLEFIKDADNYASTYEEIMGAQNVWMTDASEHVCSLWEKLMNAYLIPYGPRELNIPSPVRDRLLALPANGTPPHPSELDEAVQIVYELMNDSVLGPFLEAVSPHQEPVLEDNYSMRQGRAQLRIPKDSTSNSEESSRSPKTSFLPMFGLHRSDQAGSSSSDAAEGGLSDDSGSVGSPRDEPTTPPTTPPTSDSSFNASPGSLQRAISAHNSGWKKMGEKLGFSRKARSKRSNTTSVTSGVPDSEPSHGSSSGSTRPL